MDEEIEITKEELIEKLNLDLNGSMPQLFNIFNINR